MSLQIEACSNCSTDRDLAQWSAVTAYDVTEMSQHWFRPRVAKPLPEPLMSYINNDIRGPSSESWFTEYVTMTSCNENVIRTTGFGTGQWWIPAQRDRGGESLILTWTSCWTYNWCGVRWGWGCVEWGGVGVGVLVCVGWGGVGIGGGQGIFSKSITYIHKYRMLSLHDSDNVAKTG